MPIPVDAPLAPDLDLPDGYKVTFAALDPTTGNAVANVVVKNVSIFATRLGAGTGVDDGSSLQAVYAPVLLRTGV